MDEKKRNDEMKMREELKLEPDVMFQALVYIELAYKEGLINLKTYSKNMDKYGRKYKKLGKDLLS